MLRDQDWFSIHSVPGAGILVAAVRQVDGAFEATLSVRGGFAHSRDLCVSAERARLSADKLVARHFPHDCAQTGCGGWWPYA